MADSSPIALNDPTADVFVDATTKGIPIGTAPLRVSDIGRQGWNVLSGSCPLPLAVLRAEALAANSAWMMAFARQHELLLAPHGKSTMAPALFELQLHDGSGRSRSVVMPVHGNHHVVI